MAKSDELDQSLNALREANADFLEHLAAKFGDGRFRSAAALLRGRKAGRPASDDAKALDYANALLHLGMAKSTNDAARQAANLYSAPHYEEATRERIRKKLRTKPIKPKARRKRT